MSTRSTAKKTLQNFHARNTLWRIFEIRAQEMDCSIDYLINEAMRLYANKHGFLGNDEDEQDSYHGPTDTLGVPARPRMKSTAPGRISSMVAPGRPLPRPPGTFDTGSVTSGPPPPLPPRPSVAQTGGYPTGGSAPAPPPTYPGRLDGTPGLGAPSHHAGLTLVFQGQKVPITGAQFIIGRGSKSSDLSIKDANISRKHAAIIYHNGAYYIKDLGSTNGIEYKGKQVDSKRIDEGDVFNICGYELHFTYIG